MKTTLVALALAVLSTQALAFDYFRSMEEETARRRQTADYQRLEQDLNYQRAQQAYRTMELEQRQHRDQQNSEWVIRQLEADQPRLGRR